MVYDFGYEIVSLTFPLQMFSVSVYSSFDDMWHTLCNGAPATPHVACEATTCYHPGHDEICHLRSTSIPRSQPTRCADLSKRWMIFLRHRLLNWSMIETQTHMSCALILQAPGENLCWCGIWFRRLENQGVQHQRFSFRGPITWEWYWLLQLILKGCKTLVANAADS